MRHSIFNRIRRAWEAQNWPAWTVPIGLLALLMFSFAWFLPWQGFYWDDWPVILTARMGGAAGFWRYFQFNRPLSAWIYIISAPFLGVKPLHWQIFALGLRWLTCTAMWWSLTRVWPKQARLAACAAFLFAIYPIFAQQPISVAYTQHWMCYGLFFVSLGCMLQAVRSPRWFWPLTGLAVAAFLLEAVSMEYFIGLELLRPVLLWFILAGAKPSPRRTRLAAVIRQWAPYIIGLAVVVAWRLFLVKLPEGEVNDPTLLRGLLSAPGAAIQRLLELAMQDTVFMFIRAWANLLDPTKVDLSIRFNLVTWAAALIGAAAAFIFLNKIKPSEPDGLPSGSYFNQMLFTGALAALLGALPVWVTDRQMIGGLYNDRFGLAAMSGAALLLTVLLDRLINSPRKFLLVVSLLIGIAAGYHIQTANDYRWIWTRQTRFYWQLKWRAPDIQPGTAIFSDGEIFPRVGLYSTSTAINLLYLDQLPNDRFPYWFFSLGREFKESAGILGSGLPIHTNHRNYIFDGTTQNGFVINYNSTGNNCLEILTPQDGEAPDIEPYARQAVSASSLSQILPGPAQLAAPPADIFGPEPEHGWCYLYEKADLARQLGDWDTVIRLADEAKNKGYTPQTSESSTPFEWLPFIEGYARAGRWEEAQAVTRAAYARDRRIDASLCSLWGRLAKLNPPAGSTEAVRGLLSCP